MSAQIDCLRILPTELKPRIRRAIGRKYGFEYWILTAPPRACLRGELCIDQYAAVSPQAALSNWTVDIVRVHNLPFAELVYRARREYRQMVEMQLHSGRA